MFRIPIVLFTILILLLHYHSSNAQEAAHELPPWQPGMLDLHHISTGRGDAAFYIFPDGTTMLVDAGDMSETHPRITSPRNTKLVPNDSKTAGEWIVDYIRRFHPSREKVTVDYALITHFHDDHFGEIDHTSKQSTFGQYLISGLTEIGEHIPIGKVVDRNYPDYDYPEDMKSEAYRERMIRSSGEYDSSSVISMEEYWKFLEYQHDARGTQAERIKVGSTKQFTLKNNSDQYKQFEVRNIYGNGLAWTGWGDETFALVPQEILPGTSKPGENSLSIGIRIKYGTFDYFTGGDIAGNDRWGAPDMHSIEAQVAPVIGAVDVATLNHHGNRDSQCTFYVRSVRPRVWIQQSWSSDHPGHDVLQRITSRALYPGDRMVLATGMLQANRYVIGNAIDRAYQSTSGHVVVRVYENGDRYQVYILDDEDPASPVKKVFDSIQSR